jgi:hypothetical protein
MKALVVLILSALTASAQTNLLEQELRSARRLVDGRLMDLSPLIKWVHEKPATARPLKGWVQIQGSVTGQNSYGWVIQGRVEGQGQPRPFILKNPPKAARDEFARLKAQRATLVRQQARLKREIAEAEEEFQENKAYAARNGLFFIDTFDPNFREAQQLRDELARSEAQVQQLDTRGYDLAGEYLARCYALRTGLQYNGMLIYDHGVVYK